MRKGLAAALAALLIGAPALAQTADALTRQQLLDLSYVLGEAHALRQACEPEDQYWRARMQRMLEVERPDAAFAQRLADRFNTGFSVRQGQFQACNGQARAELARTAAKGKALAEALSRIR